jgi:hypothetical protein
VETVYDLVDSLWLLMQGCGVGFRPIIGQLTGFQKPIKEIEVIRSVRTEKGGEEYNTETYDEATGVWTIRVGDSAESWSKSVVSWPLISFPPINLYSISRRSDPQEKG